MADEPSIDEILASLDRLLKEGEGRNDEPVESAPPEADEAAASPSAHDAPTPHFFEVLDDEANGLHGDAGWDEAVADTNEGEAVADEEGTEEPVEAPAKLFVLTEAMRVDDQPSLPLGMGGEAVEPEEAMRQALEMPEEAGEPEDDESEFAAPELEPASEDGTELETAFMQESEDLQAEAAGEGQPELAEEMEPETFAEEAVAVAWDEAELQALVDQVTDDVCSAIAEQLPEMIRMALASRLDAFIDPHTKHQHTGSQE